MFVSQSDAQATGRGLIKSHMSVVQLAYLK